MEAEKRMTEKFLKNVEKVFCDIKDATCCFEQILKVVAPSKQQLYLPSYKPKEDEQDMLSNAKVRKNS